MANIESPLAFSAKIPALVGLTASIHLAGFFYATSRAAMPVVIDLPSSSVSTPAFNQLYHLGMVPAIGINVVSGVGFLLAAYATDPAENTTARQYYVLAAVTSLTALPWTRFAMMDTIQKLLELSSNEQERDKTGEGGVKALLERWSWMNMMRCRFTFFGGLLGLATFAGLI